MLLWAPMVYVVSGMAVNSRGGAASGLRVREGLVWTHHKSI
jgi:hypothetical protein